ncbi:glycosyltransferase family 2 protein [Citrobacter sp. Marseille-Q6884]|uniref:glycosyltransferase family 2 protein n=1 Tax=Citrobacter sp. Marseille-Q6884 TaxID=2956786 RepID=UPI0021B2EEC6|nr:glycosyltransferase family A protein [Citrobacter sp. Marseille-Q6884]
MKNTPKISVLIPAYNVEQWVEESLLSILRQTYENLEVIVVDDCSTDKTYELIKGMAARDSRIVSLRNSSNLGIVGTLNYGLRYCTGDYILRHDADDVSESNRITEQLSCLIENKLDLVGTQMLPIDNEGNIIGPISKLPLSHEMIARIANLISPLTHVWLCKRDIYNKLEGYRNIPYAEDFDFVLRAIDAGFKCGNTFSALTRIRHRPGNTSDVASLSQRRGHFYALKLHKQRLKTGIDRYNISDSEKILESNKIVALAHSKSTKMLSTAYRSNNKLITILYVICSCALSYYNTHYIFSRILAKRIVSK